MTEALLGASPRAGAARDIAVLPKLKARVYERAGEKDTEYRPYSGRISPRMLALEFHANLKTSVTILEVFPHRQHIC